MLSAKGRIQRRTKVDCQIVNRRLFGSATQRSELSFKIRNTRYNLMHFLKRAAFR